MEVKSNNTFSNVGFVRAIIIAVVSTALLSSCFSDGSLWFGIGRQYSRHNHEPFVPVDRIDGFQKYDVGKIDSMYIRLYIPKNLEAIKKRNNFLWKDKYFTNTKYFFSDEYYEMTKEQKIKLNKNDIQALSQEFQEYGKNTLGLLQRNKNAGFVMTGRSAFSDGKDTSHFTRNSDEFYYFSFLYIMMSGRGYGSSCYQDEFSIEYKPVDEENHELTDLIFNRAVGTAYTYKLLASIIQYKNKQVEIVNDSLQRENKPLLPKYKWYSME